MTKEQLTSVELPDAPGVYFFLGANSEILYIGKATSIRSRVRSYFSNDIAEKRSPLIEKMVKEASTVDYTVTDSVLEALILETNLIRTHKPSFNTRSKDDKSYLHVVITKEDLPRVLIVREKDLLIQFTPEEILYDFGPYPNSGLFKEALKLIRKLFKFYDNKAPVNQEKSKLSRGMIDFNRQIGLYPSADNQTEYRRTIQHLRLFFEGKKSQLLKMLEKDMLEAAKAEKFEYAEQLKRRLFALQHINDIALIKNDLKQYANDAVRRIEAYDIAHLGGKDMVGVMTVVSGLQTQNSEYRKFKIQGINAANDTAALEQVLSRRFTHDEWPKPILIVMDGGKAQKNVAEKVLRSLDLSIPVVSVVKDERHKPKALLGNNQLIESNKEAILLANSEAHRFALNYHRQKRDRMAR